MLCMYAFQKFAIDLRVTSGPSVLTKQNAVKMPA